jgi:hypothetical protein
VATEEALMISADDVDGLLEDIFEGHKDLAVFVAGGKYYYLADDKGNFCIDVRPEYRSYVESGVMDSSLYDQAVSEFRGGVPVLEVNTFQRYLDNNSVNVYSLEWMVRFFTYGYSAAYLGEFHNHIEAVLSGHAKPRLDECEKMRMRLPRFYVDLDSKVFRHVDWDRFHESYVPSDWDGQASGSFAELIPKEQRYWVVDGMDFWTLYA